MRRAAITLLLAAAVVAVVLLTRSGGSGTFEVDALFDTAKGMVPGQLVKIAGARVGQVTAVNLVRTGGFGYEARMRLSVARRFEPFRANASCEILPEGLISENFVQCNPGSSPSSPLARGTTGAPTVPVAQTSASVSLQDVLNIFSLPTDQRMGLFLDTLGVGTAGRGQDLNAILLRANRSLTQAGRALGIVAAQNHRVALAVGQTNQVLTQLAGHNEAVKGFVDHAANVVETTAPHRAALEQAVRGLPAMLEAVRHGLTSLNRVATQGSPLLGELRASAPGLDTLTQQVPPFAHAAIPALKAVAAATAQGRAAIPSALPVVRHLNSFSAAAAPVASLLDQLLVSTRDKGGIEGLMRVLYALATFSAPYDSVSHFVGLFFTLFPECIQTNMMNSPAAGCSHAYTAPEHGQAPVNDPGVQPGPNTADLYQTGASSPPMQQQSVKPSVPQLRGLLQYLLK